MWRNDEKKVAFGLSFNLITIQTPLKSPLLNTILTLIIGTYI